MPSKVSPLENRLDGNKYGGRKPDSNGYETIGLLSSLTSRLQLNSVEIEDSSLNVDENVGL